jgi:transcriptional regulator with XRE-family HTH domain
MTETKRERTPFSVLLRQYRLAASLTQEALAEPAGLSAKGIALLESGRRITPRPETLTLLAASLGDDAFGIACERGNALQLEQALTEARPVTPPEQD